MSRGLCTPLCHRDGNIPLCHPDRSEAEWRDLVFLTRAMGTPPTATCVRTGSICVADLRVLSCQDSGSCGCVENGTGDHAKHSDRGRDFRYLR